MAYNSVNFPTSGSYLIEYRVASAVNGARISSDLNAGAIVLGTLNVPNTGGWQNWQTISHTVNVNAGTYNFGIFIQTSGVNINWIKITKVANTARISEVSIEGEKNNLDNSISVFPNPTTDYLFFSKDISNSNVTIYNATGNVVIGNQNIENNINVSKLSAGIYFVSIENNSNKTIKRFVKK